MTNHVKKFSLLIQLSHVHDQYSVELNGETVLVTNNNDNLYEFDLDITRQNIIKVKYISKQDNSHLVIKKVAFNEVELHNLDMFSIYHTDNKIKKTYGWMDELGVYQIKIHGNPITQNLMTYLLSKKD